MPCAAAAEVVDFTPPGEFKVADAHRLSASNISKFPAFVTSPAHAATAVKVLTAVKELRFVGDVNEKTLVEIAKRHAARLVRLSLEGCTSGKACGELLRVLGACPHLDVLRLGPRCVWGGALRSSPPFRASVSLPIHNTPGDYFNPHLSGYTRMGLAPAELQFVGQGVDASRSGGKARAHVTLSSPHLR